MVTTIATPTTGGDIDDSATPSTIAVVIAVLAVSARQYHPSIVSWVVYASYVATWDVEASYTATHDVEAGYIAQWDVAAEGSS